MGLLYGSIGRGPTAADKLWRLNWPVIAVSSALAGIGVATLYSFAGGSFHPWAERHALRFVLALAVVLAVAMVPLGTIRRLAVPAYLAAFGLLALVPLVGVEALGARRWLSIGGVSLQPSELMKVALVVALAHYYQWLPANKVSRPLWVLAPLAMIGLPVLLTIRQPDLGTAVLFSAVGLGLMFAAGVSLWYFLAGIGGALAAAPLVWASLHDYQRRRIEVFLDPSHDPLGSGYHVTQSKIALGSGGLTGKGFMGGTQTQLDFVPEKHTDFIFVMLGEEWGLVGAVAVIGLYAALVLLLYAMSVRAAGPRAVFARLLIIGAALSVGLYAMINVAMVTGLVPVVGVPLPLVSYGGSSMFTTMAALAIALATSSDRPVEHDRSSPTGPRPRPRIQASSGERAGAPVPARR